MIRNRSYSTAFHPRLIPKIIKITDEKLEEIIFVLPLARNPYYLADIHQEYAL